MINNVFNFMNIKMQMKMSNLNEFNCWFHNWSILLEYNCCYYYI